MPEDARHLRSLAEAIASARAKSLPTGRQVECDLATKHRQEAAALREYAGRVGFVHGGGDAAARALTLREFGRLF